MKLIGAGYGRMGTMSLKGALETLGVAPCLHMIDLIRDPSLAERWTPTLSDEPVDWEAVFDGFESTVDWPACVYVPELMEAFPEAKVLLNFRDFEGWHRSMLNTVYAIRKAKESGQQLHEGTEPEVPAITWQIIGKTVWSAFAGGDFEDPAHARRVMEAHYADMRATVPAERLLEYRIGDGWEPLAEFLDVPVPDEPFPHYNDSAFFRQMVGLDPVVDAGSAPVGRAPSTTG
jgi:sulfotransferase family protein